MSDMNNPESGTQEAVSVEQQMEAFLDRDSTATTEEAEVDETQDVAGEEEVAEQEQEAEEEGQQEGQSEEETQEEEGDDEDEGVADEETGEETVFEIPTKDGEVVKFKESEMIDGVMRQQDYTKKTQALSAERQEFEKEREGLAAERQQYQQILAAHNAQKEDVLKKFENIDWEELKQDDPDGYLMKRQEFNDARQALTDGQRAQQELAQRQQEEYVTALTEFARQEDEKLVGVIDGWDNDETKAKLQTTLREYATEAGFQDQEMVNFLDSRAMTLLNKARLYDEMQAKAKTVVQKKVKPAVKKVIKSGAAKPKVKPSKANRDKVIKRQHQTGDFDDTVNAFLHLDD